MPSFDSRKCINASSFDCFGISVSAHVAKTPRPMLAALMIKILHARTPTMLSQYKTD
jgi:hypothetical protein